MQPVRRVVVLLTLVILGSAALVTPASAAGRTSTIVLHTTMTSTGTTLQTQPGGHVYGWNNLNGTTTWGNQSATIQLLADVNYVNGSGSFGGYVTITRADGTVLSLRLTGNAVAAPDRTTFAGGLSLFQGTGRYSGALGTGTMRGFRTAALGSPVDLTFTITLTRP